VLDVVAVAVDMGSRHGWTDVSHGEETKERLAAGRAVWEVSLKTEVCDREYGWALDADLRSCLPGHVVTTSRLSSRVFFCSALLRVSWRNLIILFSRHSCIIFWR